MKPGSTAALRKLAAAGPAARADLPALWGVSEATAHRRLEHLDDAGLCKRIPNPENRRVHLIVLTRKGERVIAQSKIIAGAWTSTSASSATTKGRPPDWLP